MNVCLLFVDLKYWKKCDNLTFINQEWLFYVQESQKEITLGQFIWSLFVLWGIPCSSFQWFARSKHLRLSAKSYVWPCPLWIKLWGCKLIYQSFKYFSIEERVLVHSVSWLCYKTSFDLQCVNAVSRKCEYGVLEITSDTKVLLSHESKTTSVLNQLLVKFLSANNIF